MQIKIDEGRGQMTGNKPETGGFWAEDFQIRVEQAGYCKLWQDRKVKRKKSDW